MKTGLFNSGSCGRVAWILAVLLASAGQLAAQTNHFHVAPDGNDDWSGRSAAPNAERTDGPFASPQRARDAIRELKQRQGGALSQPVTVLLRGGFYFLAEPLRLSADDTGTDQAPITYAAHPPPTGEKPAAGPLRVHPENPRYFTDGTQMPDGSLRAVYLTRSHTWANLIDRGPSDPPPIFDFDGYLDLLQEHNHNFIRLWGRHVSWYHGYGEGELRAAPLAWERTGPGNALDGKPKFDLTKLYQGYFDRLRARVSAARDRGMYVGVMLFGGNYECRGGWRGNPFHAGNNVNGIAGDPDRAGHGLKSHTLDIPSINRLQEAYVGKVIDTLNDLENVLYEISNEGHASSLDWQNHWIRFIQQYQASKPKQHPVGMTALYLDHPAENDPLLQASAADWISPLTDAAGVRNIAAADGSKVSILDSDHWFVKEIYGDPVFGCEWVWKAFFRGHHPILMEHLPPLSFVDRDYPLTTGDPGYVASRRAMGHTRGFADRVNLAALQPRFDLASTSYCLARPGEEYLVYQPKPEEPFSVGLQPGRYRYEWFDVVKGKATRAGRFEAAGGTRRFEPLSAGKAVLHLKAVEGRDPSKR